MRVKYFKKVTGISAADTVVTPPADQVPGCQQHMVTATFGLGTTGGTFVVEEAGDAGFTGTWAVRATLPWSGANKVVSAAVSATQPAVRTRCKDAVQNGTADVSMQGLG